MEKKLNNIYRFLLANRSYNQSLHIHEYKKALMPHDTAKDKLIHLLHQIVNTQSQPKMDYLSQFFQEIEYAGAFDTMPNFIKSLDKLSDNKNAKDTSALALNYNGLYQRLKNKNAWGPKTAALFTKALYKINNQQPAHLPIWSGQEYPLLDTDQLYLPVDAVIIKIFQHLGMPTANFNNINKLLQQGDWDIEVWDDLWFWGFITQKSVKREIEKEGKVIKKTIRKIEYNPPKLWTLAAIDKSKANLKRIETRSHKFINLLH